MIFNSKQDALSSKVDFSKPFVIKAYQSNFKEIASQCYSYLRGREVVVTRFGSNESQEIISFDEYNREIAYYRKNQSTIRKYMVNCQPFPVYPITHLVETPWYMQDDKNLLDQISKSELMLQSTNWLFMGGEGNHSPLHIDHDYVHTFLYQAEGKKDVILVEPELWSMIEKKSPFANDTIDCREWFAGVVPKFPVQKYTLEPGDFVYIPSCWYHATLCKGVNITLSRDWVDLRNFDVWCYSVKNKPEFGFLYERLDNIDLPHS